MKVISNCNDLILEETENFNPELTLDCGQSFRWVKNEDSSISGIAGGRYLKIKKDDQKIILYNTSLKDFNDFWKTYFDLDLNYGEILSKYNDEYLIKAVKAYPGIRILKQDEWEAICSFIISANNNIPRIKGIVERFCENFGDEIEGGYAFPRPSKIAELTVEDLAPIRSGFRAKYIIDAAQKISSGEVDIEKVKALPFDEAKNELLKIKGVGEKVAQCALLYGFHRLEAFPIDVWVKRIVSELYPKGLPTCVRGTEGIAQQYLFHWRRNLDN